MESFKELKLLFIDLYDCEFEQIPDNIMCPTLKGIGIDIKSEHLTDKIFELKELESLYLANSQIVGLPENISELKNLRVLYLRETKLRSLPKSILELKNIEVFSVNATPLAENIPPEMLNKSDYSLIRYISLIDSKANQFFNESKVLVVGQGRVGKTCVINRVIRDNPQGNVLQFKTIQNLSRYLSWEVCRFVKHMLHSVPNNPSVPGVVSSSPKDA